MGVFRLEVCTNGACYLAKAIVFFFACHSPYHREHPEYKFEIRRCSFYHFTSCCFLAVNATALFYSFNTAMT
jgi:hypothetical protein